MSTHAPKLNLSMRLRRYAQAANPEPAAVVQRPNGWYWLADSGHREVGPFATADDALADYRAVAPADLEPGETLHEAEAELGIADWIDPDTGEPAEDRAPRTEQH